MEWGCGELGSWREVSGGRRVRRGIDDADAGRVHMPHTGHSGLDWDSGPWKEEHGVARPAPRKNVTESANRAIRIQSPMLLGMGMKNCSSHWSATQVFAEYCTDCTCTYASVCFFFLAPTNFGPV